MMAILEILPELVEVGEEVTAADVVGRYIDRGSKQVPTSCSVASALKRHPSFVRTGKPERAHFRRVKV